MDRPSWNARYAGEEPTIAREPNRLVVEELETTPPRRALDVAAGEGRHAIWLASRGWHVVAVDFAETGLRRANAPGVHRVVADVDRLRLPPAHFDLVLAAFYHPHALMPALARTLAPGGTMLLVSYDIANLTEGSGGPRTADHLLDPPVIASELAALGLDVKRIETIRQRATTADGEEVGVVNAVIRADRPKTKT